MPVALAPAGVRWTSEVASRVPRRWGEFVSEDEVHLKDTRGAFWRNRLVSPHRFVYEFPSRGKGDWEGTFVSRLRGRVATGAPLRVRLFATPGSRDECYGDWVVAEMDETERVGISQLVLARLRDQRGDSRKRPRGGYRSHNEASHAQLLARIFDGWAIKHEPETLLDLHEPTVVDGVWREGHASRSYTCDFVVARGAKRVCVESKYSEDSVDDEAKRKCRALRDQTLTRVVIVAGAGEERVRWCDFGPPGEEAAEEWYDDAAILLSKLE